ncbi:CPBP family intramembrane glutamic endopeptidase [Pseudoduganella lutea]|nr:CPBP family intramembrane glutamic endopeptidase [Pseudoduganella lutea]
MTSLPPSFWPLAATWLLAVLSLWMPPLGRVPAWPIGLAIAVATAVSLGAMQAGGVVALLVLIALCTGWQRTTGAGVKQRVVKGVLLAAIIVLALALALHVVPGFANPLLLEKLQVSAASVPVSLYLNLDKTAVGIVLCATFALPARDRAAWRAVIAAWPVIVATPVIVLLAGYGAGVIAIDPKWFASWFHYAPLFLLLNLFTTCLAEEAFFRALVQGRLAAALSHRPDGARIAVATAAILFGVAHAHGGPALIVLATFAGFGYGLAYQRSGRIEAAILTHFALNATHFLMFTYPALR